MHDIPTEPNQFITQATTYNLLNDRSLLCQAMPTPAPAPKRNSTLIPGSTTLDFCYGAPADPTYPEGAVAALLRNNKPPKANEKKNPCRPARAICSRVTLPAGLVPPVSILAITNTASAAPVPGGGHSCTPSTARPGKAGGAVNLRPL